MIVFQIWNIIVTDFYCIDRLLKNVNVLQEGRGKNPTTPLYSDPKKNVKFFWTKKKIKITKREHFLKGFSSTYNAEILNSFIPELQLKDTESSIGKKIWKLLSTLRRFKFVATLVLVFE